VTAVGSLAVARWALVLAVLVAPARAGAAREPVHIRYQAPAECPVQAALEAAIRERTEAARFTSSTTARRVFAVTVARSADGYLGTITVGGDEASTRALVAPRCDDLIAALALVVALAIDPPAPEVVAPPPQRSSRTLAAIGSGAAVGGVTPGAAIGATAEARLGWRGLGHLGAGAVFGWDGADMDTGRVGFTWLAGRASGCWQWLGAAVESDLCAHAEVGGVLVRASEIVRAQAQERLWLAPGLHVALRWPATSSVFAEFQAGVSFPLVRDHYYFDPGTSIHETWAAVPWLAIGAGMRFAGSE
jgi:hypothetical protein